MLKKIQYQDHTNLYGQESIENSINEKIILLETASKFKRMAQISPH